MSHPPISCKLPAPPQTSPRRLPPTTFPPFIRTSRDAPTQRKTLSPRRHSAHPSVSDTVSSPANSCESPILPTSLRRIQPSHSHSTWPSIERASKLGISDKEATAMGGLRKESEFVVNTGTEGTKINYWHSPSFRRRSAYCSCTKKRAPKDGVQRLRPRVNLLCWANAPSCVRRGAGTRVTACDYGVTVTKTGASRFSAATCTTGRTTLRPLCGLQDKNWVEGGFLDGMTGRQGYAPGALVATQYNAARPITAPYVGAELRRTQV